MIRFVDFSISPKSTRERSADYSEFLVPHRPNKLWTQLAQSVPSWSRLTTKMRTNGHSRRVTNKQTRTSGHSMRDIFNIFYLLYKTVSLNKAKTFRCCPLRCRERLLKRLRCSTTRTTKLSTLERSVSVFTQSWQILNKRV